MSKIVLVGSVHIDHKGPERLERTLQHYRPEIVCLEQTPKDATRGWKSHLEIMKKLEETPWHRIYSPEQIERARLEFMSLHYESWVPKVYKNGSPDITLYCIDQEPTDEANSSLDLNQRLWMMRELASGKTIQDLFTPVNLNIKDFIESGSVQEHQAHIDSLYDRTNPNDFISIFGERLFRLVGLERDRRFAEQIRKIHCDNPEKVLVATLGNNHIFGDYEGNTYDLLSDLDPVRFKLRDADNL